MSASAPAAASLLAQKYSHPDPTSLADSSPTSLLSSAPASDPALQSAAIETADLTPDDVANVPLPQKSWFEVCSGEVGSIRREASWIAFSTFLMTIARNACFDKRIFGNYLLRTLAPVERDSVTWYWIVLTRVWEMCLVSFVWKRVRGGLKREGALFGIVYALVSRSGLYMFEHSYFLLSSGVPTTLLLIDCLAFLVTLSFLPTFHPAPPSARAPLGLLPRLQADPALIYNLVLAVGVVTFSTAFGSYAIERLGGSQFVKENVWDVELPAWLLRDQLTGSQMMEHPTIHVPTLRHTPPVPMSTHLAHSFLSALPLLALTSFLPTLSPVAISLLSFLIIAVPSTTLLNDVFPIKIEAALGVGVTLALKGLVGGGMMSWIVEQLRNSLLVIKRVERATMVVVDEDEQTGEEQVVAVAEVEVEDDIVLDDSAVDRKATKTRSGSGGGGVMKRKGLGTGGEVDAE
ncbi:hypothetical protein JCM10212_005435 [Sporobolomyces blumeae]